jgi:hypothetical protein
MALATPTEDSVVAMVVRQLKAYTELTKKRSNSTLGQFHAWRDLSLHALRELRDHEIEMKQAIDEVEKIIISEAHLIKNTTQHETALTTKDESSGPNIDKHHIDKQYLVTRMASLVQIKSNLESSLLTQYQLYFQLRNKADLAFTQLDDYLQDRVQVGVEIFAFSNIHRQNQTASLGEHWIIESGGNRDSRIVNYDSLSFKSENVLNSLSRQARLQAFVYDKSAWPRYYTAIKTFGAIAENPQAFVGKALTLKHFPSPGFAEAQFTVINYDSTNNTFELSHPRGGVSLVKVSDLVGKQIQLQLLHDIQSLIKADKPVLVFVNKTRHLVMPVLVTKVSINDESVAGIEFASGYEFETEGKINWKNVAQLEGIPMAMNTKAFQWEGAGNRVSKGLVGQVLSANPFVPNATVTPLTVSTHNYYKKFEFYVDRDEGIPFEKTSHWKLKVQAFEKTYLEDRTPAIPSFIEKMESLRQQIEQNGFFRERSTSFMASTWEQRLLIEDNKRTLGKYIKAIADFETPGLLAKFKSEGERKTDYYSARRGLPGTVTQTRWLSQQSLDGKEQAILLVKEILATVQRYQTALPGLQHSVAGVPGLGESLSVYIKERVVLLNQLVKAIADQQAQFEQAKKDLPALVEKGNKLVAHLNLDVEESVSSIDNSHRRGVFNSYGTRGKLNSLIYGDQKGKEILTQWFTESPLILRKHFSPAPSDFKLTKKLGKEIAKIESIPHGKKLNVPIDVVIRQENGSFKTWRLVGKKEDVPDYGTIPEDPSLEWHVVNGTTSEHLYREFYNVFRYEFADFMKQHGALYSEAMNQLIIGYDPRLNGLTGISKDGLLITTRFDEAPLFWEAFFEPSSLRTSTGTGNKVHAWPFIGRGKDLHGRSYYVYRETDQKGIPVYKQIEIGGQVEKIPFIQKGSLVPNTTLVSGQPYLMLEPRFNEELSNLMAERAQRLQNNSSLDEASRAYFDKSIELSAIQHFIRFGTPLALTNDNKVYFDGSVAKNQEAIQASRYQITSEFLLPLEKTQEQIALPLIDLKSPEARDFWIKHDSYVGDIKSYNAIMMVNVPDSIVPGGGTLIFGNSENINHNYTSPPHYILVFNQ